MTAYDFLLVIQMLYIIYSWLFLDHKKSSIYNIGYYKSYFHILFLTVNVIHYFETIWLIELLYFMSIYIHQRKRKLAIKIHFVNIIITEPHEKHIQSTSIRKKLLWHIGFRVDNNFFANFQPLYYLHQQGFHHSIDYIHNFYRYLPHLFIA